VVSFKMEHGGKHFVTQAPAVPAAAAPAALPFPVLWHVRSQVRFAARRVFHTPSRGF
jgi:hypothetical protein